MPSRLLTLIPAMSYCHGTIRSYAIQYYNAKGCDSLTFLTVPYTILPDPELSGPVFFFYRGIDNNSINYNNR